MTKDKDGVIALGEKAMDIHSGIKGVLIARTLWHDRSDECAILRQGTDSEGEPFGVHWFPVSRLVRVVD